MPLPTRPSSSLPFVVLVVTALLLTLVHSPVRAVYKCTGEQGTIYSDLPCSSSGQSLTLAPAVTPEAQRAAAQRAADERAQARRLQAERDRRTTQEETARQRLEAGRQAHDKKCKLLALKKRWGEEDASHAALKAEARAKRNARRKAEQYELECKAG